MESHAQILLVEDDARLAALITAFLTTQGFQVRAVADGRAAIAAILDQPPDGVILDMLLPGADGLEVCRTVRARYRGFILVLTAQDEDIHEVVALDTGADDYLTKPVRPQVLLARLRALLRRGARVSGADERSSCILAGDLAIDVDRRTVTRGGAPVVLTDAEFDLLWLLARRAPAVLSRDELVAELRGIEFDGLDRSIDMRVSKLRRKLGDDQPPHRVIRTVRGRGYLFVKDR
ncbi:two-component system, OmpR family, response regulator RstA [Nannocystis exedens]|uniref:Two-component system, OmpR family, response regulator RstA n=1 Tax=Nannocystis exedens TaxID=54 RepID=A0A1I2G146_9BACT|nr:response regulator transcription factor [Nannocystis exedens]PCC74593.1 DNA-binding response regulator [Nannocystis exedens]SFF10680.1 two-component system, OmpR family, response regulator RstA [Nannocystis exedens]